ncbi:MAG: kelch repeat-containing protein [Thermoplasmata archaeon]
MVYDAFSDRFVVFGGVFERGVMDETWVYDPGNNTWTSMNPESQPSPRTFPAMVYHPAARVTILYGGLIGGEGNDETWRYSLVDNSWTRLDPPFAPFPRAGHALSYDPVSGLVILFGGLVTSDPPGRHDDDETWTYDVFSNLWARREPASRPPARSQHAMTYDTQMGRVLLFGGRGIDRFNDTWAYDVANNTWTELPLRTDPDPERLPILLAVVFSVMILGILTVVFLVERFGGTSDRRRADSDKRKSRGGNQFRLRRLR